MELTHINKSGRAHMIDISNKNDTCREAKARGIIKMNKKTIELIKKEQIKKGDVLSVAQIGGIMGAKKTSELIPMCHNINITGADISFSIKDSEIIIESTVKTTGKTGVEMEALTAVMIAALSIYDMCKAVDKKMEIGNIMLVEKTGGKSGDYRRSNDG